MREEIKNSIIGFIENNERVLCLNGTWGVGKTHLITEIKTEYDKKENYEVKYAKLFGLKGMNDLIISLFFNSKGSFSKGVKSAFISLSNFINKKIGFSIDLSILSIARDKILEQYSVEKKLVIIVDDIERKDKDFQLVEFFGFVDVFKEKIKFVLVMNEDEIEDKEIYGKYKEKIIDRTITIDNPDEEIYYSILFGTKNTDNEERSNKNEVKSKEIEKKNKEILNKIDIYDNNNLRTIKTFKNVANSINLDINNDNEENIYKLKMIHCLLNFEYNNRYKKEDLIKKRIEKRGIDSLFYDISGKNDNAEKKEIEYKEKVKKEVEKKSDIECFCEYFQDDKIFCLTSTEEFRKVSIEFYNIIRVGLYEKLKNVKIEFLKKGKKQFSSERQVAFYSSTPQNTAIFYLNDVKIAIEDNEISKVSILNNYIIGITKNYSKYYSNNQDAFKLMDEISSDLLPKVADEIVKYKIYSIDFIHSSFFCENEDTLKIVNNIEDRLIEKVKKSITEYYESMEFDSIINIRKIFDNINDIDTIFGWKIKYKMTDNLINHILEYINIVLSKDIDMPLWSGAYYIIEKLKKYDDKLVERLQNTIIKCDEPLKERLSIILHKIEKTNQ